MANGFPEGDFRIINEATGARLFTRYGGTTAGPSYVTRSGSSVDYSSTNNPIVMVGSPASKDYDFWWFDAGKDSWGKPYNYLMSSYTDIRSKWALQGEEFDGSLKLWGTGRQDVSQWQAENGYIFLQGSSNQVLTLIDAGGGSFSAKLADRGAPNQTWRFESKTT
jgi:hypothetical protein